MKLTSMTPEDLIPNLPTLVTKKSQEFYDSLTRSCMRLCDGMGRGGQGFKERREKLRSTILAAAARREDAAARLMNAPKWIRPLLDLWLNDEEFFRAMPPGRKILRRISDLAGRTARKRLGRLALRELCQLFFQRYDRVPSLPDLAASIREQLGRYEARELMFGLDSLQENADLLREDGHERLADLAVEREVSLADAATENAVPTARSRFFEKSQQHYYVERLKALEANEDSPLLKELQAENVFKAHFDAGRLLGHVAMRILIDTLADAGASPSALWRATLLAIGGDPRVPPTATSYREWWVPLGDPRIRRMIGWLSEMDLGLFLRLLQEFADREGNDSMRRMYPARERLLRGLFRRGVVRCATLYLGRRLKEYVERHHVGRRKPHFIVISDSASLDLAVIHLDMGTAHLVDGTHNFALTVFDRIPRKSVLRAYPYQVERDNLGLGLLKLYHEEFGEKSRGIMRKTHGAGGTWRHDALDMLRRLGINVQEADIISEDDMRIYRKGW